MDHYKDYKLVQLCLRQIEKRLNWGASAGWHNDVFIELSEKIQQDSKVLLSPTTLKRVWGHVKYSNAPSISTLNILAQFASYENWRDFKNRNSKKQTPAFFNRINANLGLIMGGAAFMTLLFISLYSLTGKTSIEPADYSNLVFSSRPLAKGLPNSVVFDFDLSEVESDSIYIQQYWDPTKTIPITKDQTQATGQYFYPGYFRAKMVIDGQIIKEHDLFIKSDGWLGTIDYEPIPTYLKLVQAGTGTMAFKQLVMNQVHTNEEPLQTSFHLVKEFNEVSADNFELATTIKNTFSDKWGVCQMASIVIIGTKSALVIPFSISGCVSEIGVMLSDVYLSGKEHDLSAFATDLSSARNIQLKVANNNIKVLIDDQLVFTYQYNKAIGDLAGLRYRFLGTGEVSHLSIVNGQGDLVLQEFVD